MLVEIIPSTSFNIPVISTFKLSIFGNLFSSSTSIVLSKISVGNAQKREKPTLKNANHNILRRIDKNNISYESNYGIDWGEDN